MTATADIATARRQSRLDRQARVGILRNPNEPPRPPPRKASLMGRWLSLRSARRPSARQVEGAAQAMVAQVAEAAGRPAPELALTRDHDGVLSGIDIATLMASVDGLGTHRPIRTPYGAEMRPDTAPVPPPRRRPPPVTDSFSPAIPETRAPPDPAPLRIPRPQRARRRGLSVLSLVGLGVLLALLALVVVPAALML